MVIQIMAWRLIDIAVNLIQIAIRVPVAVAHRRHLGIQTLIGSRAPGAGSAAELELEGSGEGLARAEPGRQRNLEDRRCGTRGQAQGCDLESSPARIIAERLSHPRGEHTMKMVGRKIGHACQHSQIKRRVQMTVDEVEHTVHAARIFGAMHLR